MKNGSFHSSKGGFPVIAETTRNYIFSKEISQVILAAMVLKPNFYCKNCQQVISAMRGNSPLNSSFILYDKRFCTLQLAKLLIPLSLWKLLVVLSQKIMSLDLFSLHMHDVKNYTSSGMASYFAESESESTQINNLQFSMFGPRYKKPNS